MSNLNGVKMKKCRGYSLLEMMITLLIVNIILLMVTQVLTISLKVSIQAYERSFAREELTNIVNLIRRDIRNSSTINDCDANICSMVRDVGTYTWTICNGTQICKTMTDINGVSSTIYESSPKLIITKFDFEMISSGNPQGTVDSQISLLLTVNADHANESLNITNLYRQVIVSTRNYSI